MTEKHPPTLNKSMALLLKEAKTKPVTVKFLMETLSGKGRYFIIILLSLPFCQPIPLPGLSTIFGLLIVLFGISIIFGKHLPLPKTVLRRTISRSAIEKIATRALWLINKIKPLLHPRLSFLVNQPTFRILHGSVIVLLGLFLALPLPIPLTNLIPGLVIFLLALGLLEDDGALIIIAYSILAIVSLLILFLILAPFHAIPKEALTSFLF